MDFSDLQSPFFAAFFAKIFFGATFRFGDFFVFLAGAGRHSSSDDEEEEVPDEFDDDSEESEEDSLPWRNNRYTFPSNVNLILITPKDQIDLFL